MAFSTTREASVGRDADDDAVGAVLARRLRALRAQRGWSLERAAQVTGVSKAMLGQIERGESSPTVATLWRIAGGFGLGLSDFLLDAPAPAATVVRAPRLRPAVDAMLVAPLFAFDPAFGFELFEVTLLPGYTRLSEPHAAGVVEHVVVTAGALQVLLGDDWIALATGDAVRFAADRAHGYRNVSGADASFLNLIHYPTR